MTRPRILYYAHHHGSGHLRHAERFARLGVAEVLVAGTRAGELRGVDAVALEPDDREPHAEPPASPFHWTPRTPAVRRRFARLHDAMTGFRPDAVLVDVSVEVACFAALAGYRTALRRMPGARGDRAHGIAYDAVDRLFAYYPELAEDPAFAAERRASASWLGMPDPGRAPVRPTAGAAGAVVALVGTGGAGLDGEELARAARSTPGRRWIAIGDAAAPADPPPNLALAGRVPSAAPWLAEAAVIVAGAGHNTVADVAAARRPAVLIPEDRPFDEQRAFARRLRDAVGVPSAERWEDVDDWPALLAEAEARPADALARALLVDERGFADAVRGLLERLLG